MAGIAGIINLKADLPPLPAHTLRAMLDVMAHRGPDGCSALEGPNYHLGQLALNASRWQSGKPFSSAGFSIVGDVRLDDRSKLCSKLGLPRQTADIELVLQAFLKWGPACVNFLLGDFAFVVTDGQQVFAARDHMGVKPFYYGVDSQRLYFSSEAPGIACVTQGSINERRIADLLVNPLEIVDKSSTFYQQVWRLPPASTLTVRRGQPVISQYWAPDIEKTVRFGSDDEYFEAFHELFVAAVQDRVADSGEPASMLSGGIDSSTIVGFANQMGSIRTFSAVEKHEDCEDTRFISITANALSLDSQQFTTGDIDDYLPELIEQVRNTIEPFDYYMMICGLMNLAARRRGHRFLLDGLEGDMLHSHSPNYPSTLIRQGEIKTGLSEIYHRWNNMFGRHSFLILHYLFSLRLVGLPRSLAFLKPIRAAILPQRNLLHGSMIDPEFASRQLVKERFSVLWESLYGDYRNLQEQHLSNITSPAITVAAERYDRVAAQSGIEPRHPLLDKRLVEFSLGLPREQKVRQGWSKYHLRRLGAGVLPDAVSWRVGKDENAWRFLDKLNAVYAREMKDYVFDYRELLKPYIATQYLDHPDKPDLLLLYGLATWLVRHQEATTNNVR